jgi:hypothetical protein
MATVTLRPNGDGFYDGIWTLVGGTAGQAYTTINESVTADAVYITNNDTTSPYDRQSVTLDDMPAASAISSVVIKWRSRCASSTLSTVPFYRQSSTDSDLSAQVVTTTDTEYSRDVTADRSWTDTLINGLEIGWRRNAAASNALRVTQAWVEITYTASTGTSVTPGEATATITATAPSVVQSSLSVTPAGGQVAATATAPTVRQGSLSITPTAPSIAATATSPSVVQGSVSITPAAATVTITASDPTVLGGGPSGTSVTPPEATATITATAPTVRQGSLSVSPTGASVAVTATGPTVVIGGGPAVVELPGVLAARARSTSAVVAVARSETALVRRVRTRQAIRAVVRTTTGLASRARPRSRLVTLVRGG